MGLIIFYILIFTVNVINLFRSLKKNDKITYFCCLATIFFIALDFVLTVKINY